MKHIYIQRWKETNEIYSVREVPDKISEKELQQTMKKSSEEDEIFNYEGLKIPENLSEPILFLMKNRKIDINRHIEELRDLQKDVEEIGYSIDSAIYDIKKRLEQQ